MSYGLVSLADCGQEGHISLETHRRAGSADLEASGVCRGTYTFSKYVLKQIMLLQMVELW